MSEIVMITSGKGGVGKTTATALLGLQLSRMDKKVALIDTDFGLRNLDILFSIEDKIRYNIADVLRGICSAKQACIPVDTNLSVIPGTKDTTFLGSSERFSEMIEELREHYDFIIIDTPAGIGSIHRMVLPFITQGILIMTWDKASISDAIAMSRLMHTRDIPLKTILNEQNPITRRFSGNHEMQYLCHDIFDSEFMGRIPYQKHMYFTENRRTHKSIQMICSKL